MKAVIAGRMISGWCFVNKPKQNLLSPLTETELNELEQFLLSGATSDETMQIEALDGYLTAIAIGPTTLSFDQWFSRIWGPNKEDMPEFASQDEAQHIIDLIIRHFNSIITVLEHDPDSLEPIFDSFISPDGEECLDGEMWAYGFIDGVNLCQQDWQPLIEDPAGKDAFLPLFLLGSDEISPEQEKLVETRMQTAALSEYIPESIAFIYRFWQLYRLAMLERTVAKQARRGGVKVGRNDPCPCGSGKKFKKCCGAAALH
jgi:uncharacterized protein